MVSKGLNIVRSVRWNVRALIDVNLDESVGSGLTQVVKGWHRVAWSTVMWEADVDSMNEALVDGFGSDLSSKESWKDLAFESRVAGLEQ